MYTSESSVISLFYCVFQLEFACKQGAFLPHTHKPESGTGSNDRRTEKQIGIGMQCHTGPGKPNDVIFWVIYSLALLSSYGSYPCSFSWRVSIWLKAPRQVLVPLSCCYVQRISHIITVPLSMQFKANNSGNCQKGRRL